MNEQINHMEQDRPFRIVGTAKKKDNENHYALFLRILPGIPYYIVPHRERAGEFLVFSGKKKKEDGSIPDVVFGSFRITFPSPEKLFPPLPLRSPRTEIEKPELITGK